MLLTNWLRSISKRCRSPRSRKSGLRSPLAQRRASTTRTYAGRGVRREIEVLEDRTLLTSTFDIDINRTVTEGDSGTVDAVLTVTRTGTTPGDLNSSVTVDYFTQDNSATTSDNDYLAISGTLSFSADADAVTQTQTITVQINGDQLSEDYEDFWVILDNIQADNSDVTFENDRRKVYIRNDDQVQLTIDDVTVNEGSGYATLTVSLDIPADDILNVDYTTTGGLIASSPEDFEQTSGTLIFLPGETSKELYVNIIDNQVVGFDSLFYVELSNLQSGYIDAVIADDTAVVTIEDNDREYRNLHYDFEYKQQILPSETTNDNSRFGLTLAADGDTMISTTPYQSYEGVVTQGLAFVYVRNNQGTPLDRSDDTWEYQATLLPPGAQGYDHFGVSVAISGDTAVIGAPNAKDANGVHRGAVYIFTRTGSTWSLQQKLDSESYIYTNYGFGSKVAIEGDTILVGATYYDSSPEYVSVFYRTNGTWSFSQSIGIPYSNQPGKLGQAFDSSFVIENKTLIIGFPNYNNDAGRVSIYRLVDEHWTSVQTLTSPDLTNGARFGFSVSLENDELLIGQPGQDDQLSDLGSAYLFHFNSDTDLWELEQTLDCPYPDTVTQNPHFGSQVLLQDGMMFISSTNNPYWEDGNGGDPFNNGTVVQYTKVDSEWVYYDEIWTPYDGYYDTLQKSNIGFASQIALADGGLFISAPVSNEVGTWTGSVFYFGPQKPRVEITETSITEGDNGSQWMTVEVTRKGYNPGDLSQSATIDFSTSDGTAKIADGDYQSATGTLSFYGDPTALTQSQFFTVQITGDTRVEADEYFWVNLSNPTGSVGLADSIPSSAKMTINEDDQATISIGPDITVNEDTGYVTLTVSLDQPVATEVKVDYLTVANTATSLNDYTYKSSRLTFAPGEQSQTISIYIRDRDDVELDESFLVKLSNIQASGADVIFADDQAEITILDDDQAQITIKDVTIAEEAGNAVLTVSLTQPVGADMTIDFATSGNSALPGLDFESTSGTLEFHAGDESKTITIPLIDTDMVELQESFLVTLSNLQANGLNISLADDQAEVTINDSDQATLRLTIASLYNIFYSLDESVGYARAVVYLNAPVDAEIRVDYATSDGSAKQPDDYQATSGTLVFSPLDEDQGQTVLIPIIDSDLVEGLENFLVSLSNLQTNGRNVIFENQEAEVRISDNDRALITINDTTVDEDAGVATLTVSLDQPVETAVTFDYSTLSSSASAVTDFISSSGSLTISPGYLTQTISIPLVDAPEVELQEKFRVNLSNIQTNGANVIFADSQGEVTINDNDQARISVQDLVVDENTGVAAVTVSLDKPVNATVSVNYTTLDLTATQSEDYLSRSGTLIFNAGVQTQTIYIPLINSSLVEADQDFLVSLSGLQATGRDVVYAKQEAVITIADDEQAVLTISNMSVDESVGTITLTVTLEGNIESNISVDYNTSDLTAVATEDYLSTAGTLTFTPQNNSSTITVSIVDSDLVEGDERFLVNLTNIQSAGLTVTLARDNSYVTILDDDQATLSIDDVTVNEATGLATLTVSLDQVVDSVITVDVTTDDQSASAEDDYRSTSGTLAFLPGELTKTVNIALIDSPLMEINETFLVNLSNLKAGTADVIFDKPQGTVTIIDDDPAFVSVTDISVNEDAGNAMLTVSLNQPVDTPVSVDFATADQSALQSEDYQNTSGTVTFSPGEQTRTITIPLFDSDRVEADETFLVNLTNLQSGVYPVTLADTVVEVTIVDDNQSNVTIDDISVDEAAGTATLTVTLDRPVDTDISVDYATADQSAEASLDYTGVSATLNFTAGEVSKTITVPIFDSQIVEGDETFLVNLSNLQAGGRHVVLADDQAVATIRDEIPAILIDDMSVRVDSSSIQVTVSLDQAVADMVTVDYVTRNYSAVADSDYLSASGTLTFNPGELTKTFEVTVLEHTGTLLGDRSFLVDLSNLQSTGEDVRFADSQAKITLLGDEPPTITINDIVVQEGDDGLTSAVFTVTRTGKIAGDLDFAETVRFFTVEGTAKSYFDYVHTYGTVDFVADASALSQTATIEVQVETDVIANLDQTFRVLIYENTGNSLITDAIGTAIIEDDDQLELTIDDVTVDESSGTATLTVSLSGTFSGDEPLSFNYETRDGTAVAGTDYLPLTGTGSINAGSTSTTITVDLLDYDPHQFERNFDVVLSQFGLNGLDIRIADSQAQVSIQHNYPYQPFDLETKLSPQSSDPAFTSFGSNFATDGNTFITGETSRNYNRGAVQIFIRNDQGTSDDFDDDTWEFQAELIPPAANVNHFFGTSVAVNGDLAVIGAPGAKTGPENIITGSVYIYERTGSNWSLKQEITGSDTDTDGAFGTTVAIEGETVVVGATGEDSERGAVYVYSKVFDIHGGTWIQSAKLTATTPAPESNFGSSLVFENETIVIGSKNDTEFGFQSGAVYIATLVNGEWTVTQKLQSPHPHSQEHFGNSVALQGNTLVVGTADDRQDSLTSEAAYVFTLDNGIWIQTQTLHADQSVTDTAFGADVEIQDDQILITSCSEPGNPDANHIIHVFHLVEGAWVSQGAINAPVASGQIQFGSSLGIAHGTVFIGARDENSGEGTIQLYRPTLLPELSIDSADLLTQPDGSKLLVLEVTRSTGQAGLLSSPTIMDFGTFNMGDSSGQYPSITGTISFTGDPSATTQTETVILQVDSDTSLNLDATFVIGLSPRTGIDYRPQTISPISIIDNPPQITVDDISVSEAAGTATLTVSLNQTLTTPVSVDYSTRDQTATASADYLQASGTLTFNPGEQTKTITVSLVDSDLVEHSETFLVDLTNLQSGGTKVYLSDSQAEVIVTDDDQATISIDDVLVDEDAGTATLTVSLDQPVDGGIAIDFSTRNQSAIDPEDYLKQSGQLYFNQGELTQTITIEIVDDEVYEFTEAFEVALSQLQSGGLNVSIADSVGQVEITNTDLLPQIEFKTKILSPAGPEQDFRFGDQVAIDGNTLITTPSGIRNVDGSNVLAFIFERNDQGTPEDFSDDTWEYQTALSVGGTGIPNVSNRHLSVDIHDNLALVSLVGRTSSGTYTQTIYVFRQLNGIWSHWNTFSNPEYGDQFYSGTNIGVYNARSGERVVFGVPGKDGSVEGEGAIYIYEYQARTYGEWDIIATIVPPESRNITGFGSILAYEDDTLVVGAPTYSGTVDEAGAVFVYRKYNSNWILSQTLVDSTPTAGGHFGKSVDLDGNRLVIGVEKHDSYSQSQHTTVSGNAAVIYDRTSEDDRFNLTDILVATGREENIPLGDHVTIKGDTIVVGSTSLIFSSAYPSPQAVITPTTRFSPQTIYKKINNEWVKQAVVTSPANARYANQVAISSEGEVFFASPTDDESVENSGSIHYFGPNRPPEVSVIKAEVTEGDQGTQQVTVLVARQGTKPGDLSLPASVAFTTSDGTATVLDGDYSAQSGMLDFTGDPSAILQTREITIDIHGDTDIEPAELFNIELLYWVGDVRFTSSSNSTVTIQPDDRALISIDDVSVDESAGSATLTVSLDRPVLSTIELDYQTASQTATASEDYQPTSGSLIFNVGEQTKSFSIPINESDLVESDETFLVNLLNLQADTLPVTFADDQAQVTITDNDQARISIDDVTADEAAGTVTLTVSLDTPVDSSISVNYATGDQSATSPDDYLSQTGTITFDPQEQSKTFTISIFDSLAIEGDETFLVNLTQIQSNGYNVIFADDQATVTIEDETPEISIDDITVNENAGNATLTVTLDQAVANTFTVDFATSDQTAKQTTDYLSTAGTLTFNLGQLTQTINIPLVDDGPLEFDETFLVSLFNIQSSGINVIFADAQAEVTIVDDEKPTISIDNVTIQETDSGTNNAVFTITRSGKNPGGLNFSEQIDFTTQDGTAIAGRDYIATQGSINFAADATALIQTATVEVQIYGDTYTELAETFLVLLSNTASQSTLLEEAGTGTINNDDSSQLLINDVTVDQAAGRALLTVTLTTPVEEAGLVSIDFETVAGTALPGIDYEPTSNTITFGPGELSKTISIVTYNNSPDWQEPDKSFAVNLFNLKNSGLQITAIDSYATVVLENNNSASEYDFNSKLYASENPQVDSHFGDQLAVDTDTLISSSSEGVTVYVRNRQGTPNYLFDDTWDFQALIQAPEGASDSNFGASIAISGDTIVIGANEAHAEGSTDLTGAVFIYTRNGSDWNLQQKITASQFGNGNFGSIVAIEGDLLVASSAEQIGRVYIFSRDNGVWSEEARLSDNTSLGTVNYVSSLAMDNSTIVIGSNTESGFNHISTVAIVEKVNNVWSITQKLEHSGLGYGSSVDIEGNTIVVGAPDYATLSGGYTSRGRVLIYRLENGEWTGPSYLSDSYVANYTRFGKQVLLQDGLLLVSGNDLRGDADNNSKIQIFQFQGSDVQKKGEILTTDEDKDIIFAHSIGISDGTILLGAPDDTDPRNTGAIHIYGPAHPPIVSIDSARLAVKEDGSKELILEVTRSGSSPGDLSAEGSVEFSTFNLGISSSTFQSITGTFEFTGDPNAVSQTQIFHFSVNNTVNLDLENPLVLGMYNLSGDVFLPEAVSTPIDVFENPVLISINDELVSESDETVTLTVSLNQPLDTEISIDFATQSQTADRNDYQESSGTLTFAAGEQTKTITIDIRETNWVELAETFLVKLSNIQSDRADIFLIDSQAQVTIIDEDTATVSINDITVHEDDGKATLTVSLDHRVDSGITINFATVDQSAVDSEDYRSYSWVLEFSQYDYTQTIDITLTNDELFELTETFEVILSQLNSYGRSVTIADNTGIVEILDDDQSQFAEFDSKIFSSEIATDGYFGRAMAVDGDTLVVGSYFFSSHPTLEPAVYVYTRNDQGTTGIESDDTWEFQAKLTPSGGGTWVFGGAVAISGGIIVVGDTHDITNGEDSGAVYVFRRSGQTWSLDQKLVASDGGSHDYFGDEVAIENNTIVVGAYSADLRNSNGDVILENSGAVYVFNQENGDWVENAKLVADDPQAGKSFGISLALDGNTILVGAPRDGLAGPQIPDSGNGAVYVFERTTSISKVWNQTQKLTPSRDYEGQHFGESVSIEGDTLVVGAGSYQKWDPDTRIYYRTGAAYVFTRNFYGDWSEQQILESETYQEVYFGDKVEIENGMIVVQSFNALPYPDSSRTLHVYSEQNHNWTLQEKFSGSDPVDNGAFGYNFGISGNTILISDVSNDEQASNAGVIYVRSLYNLPLVTIEDVTITEGDNGSQLVTVQVTRKGNKKGDLSIPASMDFTTLNGTATTLDGDYFEKSGTLAFEGDADALSQTRTISIYIQGDIRLEDDEEFYVKLSNAIGMARLIQTTATVTITNDDRITISASDLTVNESEQSAEITVRLSHPVSEEVRVSYRTTGQSATTGTDFQSTSGTLIFNPGEQTKTITVPLINSEEVEGDEKFVVSLFSLVSGSTDITIPDTVYWVTIIDDDQAKVSISDLTIDEEAGFATLTVSLDQTVATNVSLDYSTVDGTALSGEDYESTTGTVTFNPGEQSKTITIPIINTNLIEDEESFLVNLSNLQVNGLDVILGDNQAEVTITDSDQPAFSIDDISVNEDAETAILTVTLDQTLTTVITVDFATADQIANSISDYQQQSGTLTFNPGETTKTIQISMIDSDITEADETFLVNLLNPQSSVYQPRFASNQAVVTIHDDDQSTLSIDDIAVDENTGSALITVSLDQKVEGVLTVDFATADQVAVSGTDYLATSGTLTFNPNNLTQTISVPLVNSELVELDEVFLINIFNLQTQGLAVSIADPQGEVTIRDDDRATVTIDELTVNEETGSATLTVSLDHPVDTSISLDYSTADGTATSGNDYQLMTGTLTFNPNQQTQTITIPLINTDLVEDEEYFLVNLSNLQPNGRDVVLGMTQTNVTITDTDQPAFSINDITVNEGTGTANVTVTLDQPLTSIVTVDFSTSDQTATSGSDYQAASGTLIFNPGDTSIIIQIPLIDTDSTEVDETFLVNLSNPQSSVYQPTLAVPQAVVTIQDNDPGSISINDITVDEGAGTALVTVSLDREANTAISVNYATTDDSAVSGSDYQSTSGTLTFNPGDTSLTISIPLIDSDLIETAESFYVNLSNLQAPGLDVSLADDRGQVTIKDDDRAILSIQNLTVDEDAGTVLLTVSLDQPLLTSIAIDFETLNGTALANSDFTSTSGTLIFNTGITTQTISLTILDDDLQEPAESFFVKLSSLEQNGSPVDLVNDLAEITILDNDLAKLSINDIEVNEDLGTATLTVSLDRTLTTAFSVDFLTIDGTAEVNSDYLTNSGTLTFNPGDVTKTIDVSIVDSDNVELTETLQVQLTNLQAADYLVSLSDPVGEISILDDDQATLSIDDITVDENSGTAQLTVSLSQPVESTVLVEYATADQTAVALSDYLQTSGTLTFYSGETTKFITVNLVDNDQLETDENLLVNLSQLQSSADVIILDNQGLITIHDEDQATISLQDVIVSETAGKAILTVLLDKSVDSNVTLNFTTIDQSATSPEDYVSQSGILTFASGTKHQTIEIDLVDSAQVELLETFDVQLSNIQSDGLNFVFADDRATITIKDDDLGDYEWKSKLYAEGTVHPADVFGYNNAVDGDTLISGSPGWDHIHNGPEGPFLSYGGAFIYVRNDQGTPDYSGDDTWDYQSTLFASDADTYSDNYGWSVDISGDTAVVGAPLGDGTIDNIGSAYVYTRSNGVWTFQQELNASDAKFNSFFGSIVTIEGDTIVVGARVENNNTGSAYVFTRVDGVWTETAKLVADDAEEEMNFANTIDIENSTIVVGAMYESETYPRSGAVYIFTEQDGVWTQSQKLKDSTPGTYGRFGNSVSLEGDLLLIGAPSFLNYSHSAGKAVLYQRNPENGLWSPLQNLVASDAAFNSYFGTYVEIHNEQIFVSASSDPTGVDVNGAVYRFEQVNQAWVEQQKFSSPDADPSDYYGASFVAANDMLLISARYDDDVAFNTGSLYLYGLPHNPAITIDDVSITEADDGSTMIIANVTRTATKPGELIFEATVDFSTIDGTATIADGDYENTTGTITFESDPNASSQTQTISIRIYGDTLLETDETFGIELLNVTGHARIADSEATITIENDDQATISINDAIIDEDAGSISITVSLDHPIDTSISVDYATADQTANSANDYTTTTGTLTFSPGDQSQTIVIPITDTDLVEWDETFLVNLSGLQTNGRNVVLGDAQAVITIHDNDQAAISINDAIIDEDAGSVSITVSLDHPIDTSISVDYATADQTANSANDYTATTGTLTFSPEIQSQTIVIPITDTNLVELDETFLVNLSGLQTNGRNVELGDAQAVITIHDDDQAAISINDTTIDEDAGSVSITVSLDHPIDTSISVDYATADQTANSANDYTTTTGTLTFSPGDQSQTIVIPITDTDLVEWDETFLVNLSGLQSNGRNVELGDAQAVITIHDDDQAAISINDISVSEDVGTAMVTVTLDMPVTQTISVNYALNDLTALSSSDYTDTSGTLNFLPGDQTKTISISITDTDIFENDEIFQVQLSQLQANGLNVVLEDDLGEVTIVDEASGSAEIQLRVVDTPTITELSGESDTLPTHLNNVSEWDTYWVEFWIDTSIPVNQGVFSAGLDFHYDTAFTSATEIEYGAGFDTNQSGTVDDQAGTVSDLYAETSTDHLGESRFLLFARLKFEPLATDQVVVDMDGKSIGPYHLGFDITSQQVSLSGDVPVYTSVSNFSQTHIWANPFDFNDDDKINYRDLILLAGDYNDIPSESDSQNSWISDLNQDNKVNYRDLILLVGNYGKNKADNRTITYAANYPEVWNQHLLVNTQTEAKPDPETVTQSAAENTLTSIVEQIQPELDPVQQNSLAQVSIQVVDLQGDALGHVISNTIYIDANAAGYGWFIDTTPFDHSEFVYSSDLTLIALEDGPAANQIDLWTVIMHELGHILGVDHAVEGVMQNTLDPGIRKLPGFLETLNESSQQPENEIDDFFSDMTEDIDLIVL